MRRARFYISIANIVLLMVSLVLPIAAQTRITAPKNPYSLTKDVELGQQAANEVEKKMPVIKNAQVERYIESVGRRLVSAIPAEYQHEEFRYTFSVVDVKEINAFALPGGFTYVNRGLIDVAHNEGELAGVMAHELSHVALRHGTAQAAKAQKYAVGAAAGQILGAIIGGGLGSVVAQGSQLGVGAYFLRFSREYEKQADLLGAQIMANAGYDPRDLANMFRTIEKDNAGRGGPEWLSDHANPGNRYQYINQEAAALRVRNSQRVSRDFTRVQGLLRELPPPRSMSDIARSQPRDSSRDNSRAQQDGRTQRVSERVPTPSTQLRAYDGKLFRVSVPDNWRDMRDNDGSITFAPEGAYGEVQGRFVFTHGLLVGTQQVRHSDLRRATDELLDGLQTGNPNLQQQGGYQRSVIDGRAGLFISFINKSEATGQPEVVNVYTTLLRDGKLLYFIPVTPQKDYSAYQRTFQNIVRSVQLND